MTNRSLIRVNQKLAQALILLRGAEAENLSIIHINSILEGAAFHLVCAYQHYLRELTEVYGVKQILEVGDESALVKALQSAARHPAEAHELLELRIDQRSWLAQLYAYYNSLWKVPIIDEPHDDDHSLIQVVNLDAVEEMPQVTASVIAGWHTAFVELVRRQRETSAEF